MLIHFLPSPSTVYHVVEIEITPSRFSKILISSWCEKTIKYT